MMLGLRRTKKTTDQMVSLLYRWESESEKLLGDINGVWGGAIGEFFGFLILFSCLPITQSVLLFGFLTSLSILPFV